MKTQKKISTRQIGDGKLPNKYWVCQSNDVYEKVDGVLEWRENAQPESEVIGIYNTYTEAMDAVNTRGNMTNVTVEDRITGELFSKIMEVCPCCKNERWYNYEDVKFTNEKLGYDIRKVSNGQR